MEKKPIVSVTDENERISIINSLPYITCVLRFSCVVSLSIRHFKGKGEKWKRKRKRGEGKELPFSSPPPPSPI